VWATTLFDEVVELGYPGSYPSFTRALRVRELRPGCATCASGSHRESAIIDHPAGEETQFDWLELPDPPAGWGLGGHAHLLVGSLAHSSRWRGVLAESEDQPHLIEGLDGVLRRLGGVTRFWRFDRMATVCHPGSGRVTASFAAVARHYCAGVRICPSRRGQRKGVVEKPTTPRRSAGGAPWPMSAPRRRPRPTWTGSAPGSATPEPAATTARGSRWPSWPPPNPWLRCPGHRIRRRSR
ncbi:MAG: hypothetical protein ACRDZY_21725, partial [Acidimicrobiales bacterium]